MLIWHIANKLTDWVIIILILNQTQQSYISEKNKSSPVKLTSTLRDTMIYANDPVINTHSQAKPVNNKSINIYIWVFSLIPVSKKALTAVSSKEYLKVSPQKVSKLISTDPSSGNTQAEQFIKSQAKVQLTVMTYTILQMKRFWREKRKEKQKKKSWVKQV